MTPNVCIRKSNPRLKPSTLPSKAETLPSVKVALGNVRFFQHAGKHSSSVREESTGLRQVPHTETSTWNSQVSSRVATLNQWAMYIHKSHKGKEDISLSFSAFFKKKRSFFEYEETWFRHKKTMSMSKTLLCSLSLVGAEIFETNRKRTQHKVRCPDKQEITSFTLRPLTITFSARHD